MIKPILLSILLLFTCNFCRSQTSIQKHGKLSVKGNQILDQHGNPPQLRGLSFSWSIWQGQKYYNTQVVDWLVKDFKTTLLRTSMAIEPEDGYLHKPEEQTMRITKVVDHAISKGLYVLIDWHDHNASKHKEQSQAFFTAMAKRYAGKPNVMYEIWNEPEKQDWTEVKAYAIEIITAIRKYDPENLIVVGSPQWDQDVDVAALNPISGFQNIAYSFHFYASDVWHQDGLRRKAEKAMKMGLPLIVTEWGVGEADGNGKFDLEKTTKWLNWLEANKLSWANWNITDKDETTALLLPGTQATGTWKNSQLTAGGKYIRKQLRKLNK